jgi:outer membrane receptor protein involved in Fe transport
VHADLTGDLGRYHMTSPWADDSVKVNLGVEHRTEQFSFAPDGGELSGVLAGFSGASSPIDRSVTVKEAFTEVRVPIIHGRRGIEDLVFDTGYRHSDYSSSGSVSAYKFEVQYSPLEALRFRGSYQRAIRAPNIIDLFSPLGYGQSLTVGVDPCAVQPDGSPATATLDKCLHTGVTAAQYGDGTAGGANPNTIPQCVANQCGQVTGGNTQLKPERANSHTIGLTFSPSALPTLTGSIDYYSIKLDDAIGVVPPTFALQQCLDTGDPRYCSSIVRTPIGGLSGASIAGGGYIISDSQNIGKGKTTGIDVQASYRLTLPAPFSTLSFALNGAELLHTTATPAPGLATYDCVGLYGNTCQTLNPRWRHTFRTSLGLQHNLLVSLQWRFISAVKLDSNTSQAGLTDGNQDEVNGTLGARSYLDLTTQWSPTDSIDVRLGINNLLDRNPPLATTDVSGTGGPNTFPTYDILGRQIFLATTMKF